MKFRSRAELRTKLIDTFSHQDEVYQISMFGTEVDGSVDEYSDIDIMVCSSDRQETQRKYQKLFEDISPIIGRDFIGADQKCFAEMVILRDYNPYQKVDFSIVGELSDKAGFGPFAAVYEDPAKKRDQNSVIVPPPSLPGVVQKLNDALFSIPRFTKCLFRRDGINLYRRWASVSNATMVLWREKHAGWQAETIKKKLTPPEVRALTRNLDDDEARLLGIIYPGSAIMDTAKSFQACIRQFIELSRQKAQDMQVRLDDGFIEYMGEFMDNEIKHGKEKGSCVIDTVHQIYDITTADNQNVSLKTCAHGR